MKTFSARVEDYLEALFSLETSGEKQTITALSKNLNLTKGTVTTIIKRMAEKDLVTHQSYGEIQLTPKGRLIGWKVFMNHERLTLFLRDFLGGNPKESEEIACLIEHHFTGNLSDRLFNLIHSLIQAKTEEKDWALLLSKELSQSVKTALPLSLFSQKEGVIRRISGNKKTMEFLEKEGLSSGMILKNISFDEAQNEFHFVKENTSCSLPFKVASTLWLE